MRLLLVRHGVTPDTGTVLTGRLPGVALSPQGEGGAREMATFLAEEEVTAVYMSPIRRCRETARVVAQPHGLGPITEHCIIETDYGTWAGRRLRDLRRLKAWDRLMAHPVRFRFPQGETLEEVRVRAAGAVEDMVDRHGADTVIAVSHADVIRALLCHYLGSGVDHIHRLDVRPASLSIVELAPDGGVAVPVVNHTRLPVRNGTAVEGDGGPP